IDREVVARAPGILSIKVVLIKPQIDSRLAAGRHGLGESTGAFDRRETDRGNESAGKSQVRKLMGIEIEISADLRHARKSDFRPGVARQQAVQFCASNVGAEKISM